MTRGSCVRGREKTTASAKRLAQALKALTGTRLRVFWPRECVFKGKVVAFDHHDEAPRAVRGRGRGVAGFFQRAAVGPVAEVTPRAALRGAGNRRRSRFCFVKGGGKEEVERFARGEEEGRKRRGCKAATSPRRRNRRSQGRYDTVKTTSSWAFCRARNAKSASAATHARRTSCDVRGRDTHEDASAEPSPIAVADLSRDPAIRPRRPPAPTPTGIRRIEDRHNLERRGSRAARRGRARLAVRRHHGGPVRRGKRTRAGRPQGEEGRRPRGARSGRGGGHSAKAAGRRCDETVPTRGVRPSFGVRARTIEGVETETSEAETRRWHAFRVGRSRRGPR